MSCGCGNDNDFQQQFSRDQLAMLARPTWQNVLLWLSFFIAVLSFLRSK